MREINNKWGEQMRGINRLTTMDEGQTFHRKKQQMRTKNRNNKR
jgi:hypothetical protein